MRDFINNFLVKRAISPVVVTDNTAQVSQIIDMQGFSAAAFLIALGTLSDPDTTVTTLLEESDASNMAASNVVADADMISQDPAALPEAAASFQFDDDNEVRKLGYIGNKRYIRLTLTPANNTGNIPVSALALLASPSIRPVVQTAS